MAGYQGGVLPNHNHSTTPGDGGQLSSPAIAGVATETGTPSGPTDVPTFLFEQAMMLLV